MDVATLLRKARLMIRRCEVCGQPVRSPRRTCSESCAQKALTAMLAAGAVQRPEPTADQWLEHYKRHGRFR